MYSLKQEKQPATKADIQKLILLIEKGHIINQQNQDLNQNNIFSETLKENSSQQPSQNNLQ